jgi:hypothetical protein
VSVWTIARRALPFTFAIYVLEAVPASFVALPAGVELEKQLRASSWDASQWALLLETLPELAALARTALLSSALSSLLLLLLGPWLQMSWLASLDQPTTVLFAVSRGGALVLRACFASVLVALVVALASAPFLALAYTLHDGLAHSTDAKFHDLMLCLALAPLVPLALVGHTLHDLTRAGALHGGAVRALRLGLRAVVRWRVLLRSLGFGLLGLGLVLGSQAMAHHAGGSFRFLLGATVLQSALLGRLFVRSAWLATALTCVAPTHAPGAAQPVRGNDE